MKAGYISHDIVLCQMPITPPSNASVGFRRGRSAETNGLVSRYHFGMLTPHPKVKNGIAVAESMDWLKRTSTGNHGISQSRIIKKIVRGSGLPFAITVGCH